MEKISPQAKSDKSERERPAPSIPDARQFHPPRRRWVLSGERPIDKVGVHSGFPHLLMKTPASTIWLRICFLLCVSIGRTAAEDKVHTPEKGSAERKVLLDGVRAAYAQQDPAKPPVIFQVPFLKVHGDWAWIRVAPQSKDGAQKYEPQAGLFRRQGGKWIFVTWEPAEEGTDSAAFFAELKAKHPDLPADILPK